MEGRPSAVVWAAILLALAAPADLLAVDWPWKKKADEVTAQCRIAPAEIEHGFAGRLRATAGAADSRGHPLAYVWSTNGGVLQGNGPAIEIDASKLSPGVYSVAAKVQDPYQHSAECRADFRVVLPPDSVTMSCSTAPAVLEPGAAAEIQATASDQAGHALRYRWFSNAGTIQGEGAVVRLDTTGLGPGTYTVTGRVDDGWGAAADCVTTVKVELPPPPPVPAEPAKLTEIVFPLNRQILGVREQTQLDAVLQRLQAEPTGRISIEAYAGPEERQPNQLAASRAEAVKQYLLGHGAPESRIQVLVGLGGRRGGTRNRTLDVIWLPEGAEY